MPNFTSDIHEFIVLNSISIMKLFLNLYFCKICFLPKAMWINTFLFSKKLCHLFIFIFIHLFNKIYYLSQDCSSHSTRVLTATGLQHTSMENKHNTANLKYPKRLLYYFKKFSTLVVKHNQMYNPSLWYKRQETRLIKRKNSIFSFQRQALPMEPLLAWNLLCRNRLNWH